MTIEEEATVEELKKYITVLENQNAELNKVIDEIIEENREIIELLDGVISGS